MSIVHEVQRGEPLRLVQAPGEGDRTSCSGYVDGDHEGGIAHFVAVHRQGVHVAARPAHGSALRARLEAKGITFTVIPA